MQLFASVSDGKLRISSKPNAGIVSKVVILDVRLTTKVKTLLKDFIIAFNKEDVLDKFIHLTLLFARFDEIKDSNKQCYEYFIRHWTMTLRTIHSILFTPPEKIVLKEVDNSKPIDVKREKKKAILIKNRKKKTSSLLRRK